MAKKKDNVQSSGRTLKLVSDSNMPFNYVESFKSLRTNLKFIASARNAKSFIVTSALAMETKTNVAINLAVTLAEENKKVVLIDCDLRKPSIHRYLKINSDGKGLSSVLSGESKLADSFVHDDELKIDILPAGTVPPNPTELFSQERMGLILELLKKHYDYVVLDTPPVSVVTDAAILGGMVDGALLVIRSDFAPVEMNRLAKKRLEDVNVNIFGVILSRFNPEKSRRQSGYYYSYYKRRYGRYGDRYSNKYSRYGYSYDPYGYGYGYGHSKKESEKKGLFKKKEKEEKTED